MPFFFFPLDSSGSGTVSAAVAVVPSFCEAVHALTTVPLPPLALFRITGPKLCIGGFAGSDGNSAAEGVRWVLLAGASAYEAEFGVVTTERVGCRLTATLGLIQGDTDNPAPRLVEAGAGPDSGEAAVPQEPCRALRAEGVVEDLIFNTRAPPEAEDVAPVPANGG